MESLQPPNQGPTPVRTPTAPKQQVRIVDVSELFQRDPEPVLLPPKPSPKRPFLRRQLVYAALPLVLITIVGTGTALYSSRQQDRPQPSPPTLQESTQKVIANHPGEDISSPSDTPPGPAEVAPPMPTVSTPSRPAPAPTKTTQPASAPATSPEPAPAPIQPAEHFITYYNSCFSPSNLTIKKGDTVTFRNNSSQDMWPASDSHPAHDKYVAFDSGGSKSPGETYSFSFSLTGAWGYHDHLRPKCSGTITVQ